MSPLTPLQQASAWAGIFSVVIAFYVFLNKTQAPPDRNQTAPPALHVEATGSVATHEPVQSDQQARCPGPPGQLYIFPNSGNRILQPEELQSLPTYKLRIARNEIFARHGLRFHSDMKTYFACEPWYRATTDNVANELSPVEHANVASILRAEHRQ